MPYYQGDFYQGDPFFGSLFSLAKRGIGMLTGIGARRAGPAALPASGTLPTLARGVGQRVGAMVAKHPVLSAAGAAGTIGILGGGVGRMTAPAGHEKGFHVNKHGKLVRNRRMRVTNPKALRRAIRRAHGFARLAKKVLAFTHPRMHRGRAYFKKARRARA